MQPVPVTRSPLRRESIRGPAVGDYNSQATTWVSRRATGPAGWGGAIFHFSADVYLKATICTGNCAANYADEIYTNATVRAECTDLDVSQVVADEVLVQDVFLSDPLFCDAPACEMAGGSSTVNQARESIRALPR